MQSIDILRSSEPGSSQNLNGNLNSLGAQEFKNVPFYQDDLTKPFLTEHLAEKLKLPLKEQLHSHHCTFEESLASDSFASNVSESHPHTVPAGTWQFPRCYRPMWRTAEALMNAGDPGFLNFSHREEPGE